jgi:hypothetical protein
MLIYADVNCAFSPIYALSRTHLRGFKTYMVRPDLQGRSFIDSIKEEVAPIYPAYLRRPMVFSPDGYSRIPDLNSFTIDP